MNIRTYQGTDLDAIIEIWNHATPHTPIDRKIFVKNFLLDHNFNDQGFFVAEEKGEILGYVYAIVRRFPTDVGAPVEDEKGYINAIGLKYEKDILGGLGSQLINTAENYIRSHGKQSIYVSGYTPNYIYQGINALYTDYIALLRQTGYAESSRSASIRIDLTRYSRPEEIDRLKAQREQEGFLFTPLTEAYILELFKYASPNFNHRLRRILQETMDYGKYNLVVYNGKVIGATVFGDPYSCEERFGPYSVSPEFRGKGLGKILLHDCLTEMKSRGLKNAWAQSTPMASTATFVYEKAGFYRTGEYITLQKSI